MHALCVVCQISVIEGGCRTHARLCHAFGVKQMIVCVNKMDDIRQHRLERFIHIKTQVSKMLAETGYINYVFFLFE